MQKSLRILGALILVAVAIWGWRTFFPSAETVIRSRLNELAATISFSPTEGSLDKLANSRKAASFFTDDVVITVDVPGYGDQRLEGGERLFQSMMFMRQQLNGLEAEFLDINVTLQSDGTALANFTAKITIPGQADFTVQELNVRLRNTDGEWRFYQVETVKTLSRIATAVEPGA
jgi:hypothetical protein